MFDTVTKEVHSTRSTSKDTLVPAPVLVLPRTNGRLTDTDACDKNVGCVLRKEELDGTKIHSARSETLNAAELNYNTPQKDCLDVGWLVVLLRTYVGWSYTHHLYGSRCIKMDP